MVAELTCPLCREVSNFEIDQKECPTCRFSFWPVEIEDKISNIAGTILGWLQDAAGDMAGHDEETLKMNVRMDPIARKKIQKAEKDGVRDLCGWYADEVYDDENWCFDLTGDRIYDEASQIMQWLGVFKHTKQIGHQIIGYRLKIAIARKIHDRAHTSLKNALDKHIADWKEDLLDNVEQKASSLYGM